MHYYYGPMMDGNDWGLGVVMVLFWLAFFVVIAVIGIRLLRNHDMGTLHRHDPIDIARERYAKGELTKEQFDQLKNDLK